METKYHDGGEKERERKRGEREGTSFVHKLQYS